MAIVLYEKGKGEAISVATIQGEQDEIIRSPQPGVLVVQGGPGTGKTRTAAVLLAAGRQNRSWRSTRQAPGSGRRRRARVRSRPSRSP